VSYVHQSEICFSCMFGGDREKVFAPHSSALKYFGFLF